MPGIVKKSLLTVIASGTLVLGGAGFAAAADSATATGSTTGNDGVVAGDVVQDPADVPVQVCGDTATAATANDGSQGNACMTEDNTASIAGISTASRGVATGDVIGADANTPVQVCGVDAQVVGTNSGATGNICDDSMTAASALGATDHDSGVGSGNVVEAVANAPVQVCGDSAGVLAFNSPAEGNICTNG